MKNVFNKTILSMAIAIFSMFFGAGNAVFPLLLGIKTQGSFNFAFLGLLLTGIGGPLLGLLAATLFHGKFLPFFKRAGRIPGALLIGVTLALLGPIAVMPRCVTVAYAAINPLLASPLWLFALLFGALTLFFCWKRGFILSALGYVLSPLLIGCLLIIIYQGFAINGPIEPGTLSCWSSFKMGLTTGYDTMDLIASIYFSAGIWTLIELSGTKKPDQVFKITLKAGLLGCLLLAGIYFGLTHAAARFGHLLVGTAPEQLMPKLAFLSLGPKLGLIANLAIALACLTTVISLAMTMSDIVSKEIFPKQLSYKPTLSLILLITTVMANAGFSVIMSLLHPVVSICYPVMIALTLVNIFSKLKKSDAEILAA